MNILIKNAFIVTMDEEREVIEKGYLFIEGETIKSVGAGEYKGEIENTKVINGENYCVMPGLINAHTHAAMTLLRGYGEGLPLMQWLNEKIWPMEAKFKEEHIKTGTELACIEMLRSGTTTFNDMYFMQEQVLEVVKHMNMRAVLGIPIIGEAWESQLKASLDIIEKLDKEKSENLKMMFAPHSPYTLSYDALKSVAQIAKEKNKGVHIHVSETEDESNIIREKYNKTTCELLEETGILKNPVVAAHCVHLTKGDMNILKKSEVSPVYNPQSNMKLASGTASVGEMLDMGINVCIGTDGTSSNNNLNMFEEMETAAFLQKLKYSDATMLSAKNALKMATYNGAKALGFKNLGVIKEGFKGDIIMLDLNRPNMVPIYDIHSNLVFSTNGSEVQYVIVNGNVIMEKGEFLNVDEEKIIYESNKMCKKLIY
ncbi:amidohydrolase [Haloimpatiens lingqiaonensis]|uniref:amidohydrolase n=1 Tax=Haloimpatiens lingqiaonensis TaxID=1380675 RepID=UPI0010FD460C|nr:amidohydrolase [Haloimpatiens lingqiaonensis]